MRKVGLGREVTGIKDVTEEQRKLILAQEDKESCKGETEIERGKTERKTRYDTGEKERL